MFGLGLATKIYIAVEVVDMRKGFEGLYGLVRDQLGADPLSGHLFLFSNRTRTRLKALVWDGSGRTKSDSRGLLGACEAKVR
jgi:transposase